MLWNHGKYLGRIALASLITTSHCDTSFALVRVGVCSTQRFDWSLTLLPTPAVLMNMQMNDTWWLITFLDFRSCSFCSFVSIWHRCWSRHSCILTFDWWYDPSTEHLPLIGSVTQSYSLIYLVFVLFLLRTTTHCSANNIKLSGLDDGTHGIISITANESCLLRPFVAVSSYTIEFRICHCHDKKLLNSDNYLSM